MCGVFVQIGGKRDVPGVVIRVALDRMMKTVREAVKDFSRVRDVYRSTLKDKKRLESEALSLLRTWQESRRLEREIKVFFRLFGNSSSMAPFFCSRHDADEKDVSCFRNEGGSADDDRVINHDKRTCSS